VRRYPLDGSGAKVVWQPTTSATAGTESLAVTGGNLYWSVGGSPASMLTKPVNADATVAPTTAFTPDARASFLRVQGDDFYWATGDYQDPSSPPKGQIYRRLIAAPSSDPGTAIVTVDQGNFGNFMALDVTTDAIYWVSSAGQGTPYELRTVPLAGGTPAAVPRIAGAPDTAITQANGAPVLYPIGNTLYITRKLAAKRARARDGFAQRGVPRHCGSHASDARGVEAAIGHGFYLSPSPVIVEIAHSDDSSSRRMRRRARCK
jgi:hypothetical protein